LQNAANVLIGLGRESASFTAKPLLRLQEAVLRLLMGRLTSSFGTPAAPPLWTPSTNRDLDALLDVDADSVAAITTWFSVVSAALATMHPAAPTLWPEHFDLAVTVAGATYGGSPGDVTHAMPYLYVTPPGDLDPDGDRRFWNEPFGASLSYDRVAGVADAVAFFAAAEAHLAPRPTEVGS